MESKNISINLTESDCNVIKCALNAYWNDAHFKLQQDKSLGDLEKKLLEEQRKITLPLLRHFEHKSYSIK